MYVIGLTGNFGTGKTTVANILANLGATVIHADELGHYVLENDGQVREKVVAAFGKVILDSSGKVDRRKLGKIAFSSQQGTDTLNGIMLAMMRQQMIDKIEQCRKEGVGILVLESALLPRNHWDTLLDEFWITTLPQDVIVERMSKQRRYSEIEVQDRIKRQMSPEDMLKQADIIINTDCTPDELRATVGLLWKNLLRRIESKSN